MWVGPLDVLEIGMMGGYRAYGEFVALHAYGERRAVYEDEQSDVVRKVESKMHSELLGIIQ